MILTNNTGSMVRLERWIMSRDGGLASIDHILLHHGEEFKLDKGKSVSIYDGEFYYIGCLYDEPVSYKKQCAFIEKEEYKINISGENAILVMAK